ncbi:hypothetical protein C5167_042234 [Papaver somniferum]|uniref:Uncharacterized protein n=1 Tax=Papaver somniferum TaxID=3469 RepID=A0A4Y7L5F5_PAPSO|nr:hypothetical protein C5167_042234 [Papaver somniferum]
MIIILLTYYHVTFIYVAIDQSYGLIVVHDRARVAGNEDKWLLIEKEQMLLLSGGNTRKQNMDDEVARDG